MAGDESGTPWRQGHVLTDEAAEALGLVQPAEVGQIKVVVISHDCDLARPPGREPDVEVIPARVVSGPDGNCTHAKNSRKLHLPFQGGGDLSHFEFLATGKRAIPKMDLFTPFLPDENVFIKPTDLDVLRHWLAARYRRAAFPDEFERRLAETRLGEKLAKLLKPLGDDIIAVFFDVDEGQELTKTRPDDLYGLHISLLYSTEKDPEAADRTAKAADDVIKAFTACCYDRKTSEWKNFELLSCEPISDQVMTYRESLRFKKWNRDDLSFRADPPQSVFEG
jgi:hypothetical protein